MLTPQGPDDVLMSSSESEIVSLVVRAPQIGGADDRIDDATVPSAQSPRAPSADEDEETEPVPQGPVGAQPGDSEGTLPALLSDQRNPLDEIACPNPNCHAGTYVPGVDDRCSACNCDVRVNVAQRLAVARQADRTAEISDAAGITMPSLQLHKLSAASEKTLCKKTHRSFSNFISPQGHISRKEGAGIWLHRAC
jgi:hypothetical protein